RSLYIYGQSALYSFTLKCCSRDPLFQALGKPMQAAFYAFLREPDGRKPGDLAGGKALPVIKLKDQAVSTLFRNLAGHLLKFTHQDVALDRAAAPLDAQ